MTRSGDQPGNPSRRDDPGWSARLAELERRRDAALAMGGPEKLDRRSVDSTRSST